MNAVANINVSWNEITERSLKGVWKNIWPYLNEVNVEDVEEIVQETAASLSNDELKELTEQEEKKNIDSSDFEEEKKELSMAFVERSLTTITEIMYQFVEMIQILTGVLYIFYPLINNF
ncbi:uncharacterized protein TNCV_965301 [Trichonephila clavipes]|nr:uncharacterized protein TNCV_965301 [Trichonephila clavipes]